MAKRSQTTQKNALTKYNFLIFCFKSLPYFYVSIFIVGKFKKKILQTSVPYPYSSNILFEIIVKS